MPESPEVWFATSNRNKFAEARMALGGFNIVLRRLPSKGSEVQSDDVLSIAKLAAEDAFAKWRRPLFVEDTGLFIASLNGFPGPYASFVERTIGYQSILRLMEGAKKRDARFLTAVAYCEDSSCVRVFSGALKGVISTKARGSEGFGFDPIFVPFGGVKTLAEMSRQEKSAISHRSVALRLFGKWFEQQTAR